MKFQNSSIHGFQVMLCIKKRDERTEGRTDGRTNNPEAICPSNFFEVGGIKIRPDACKNYNFQTVSRRNWILCSLVSDFQQRIKK